MQQSSWNKLLSGCTITSYPAGNIICNVDLTLGASDQLRATWKEPRLRTSTGDNGGTAVFDLYGLPY